MNNNKNQKQPLLNMKILIKFLKIIAIILSVISIFFFTYSMVNLMYLDCDNSFIDKMYHALGTYSSLYKFTFVVCAFWVTLRQLEISQINNKNTLEQIKFVKEDIDEKKSKEIKNDTLKQCEFYLTEIQTSYMELIKSNIMHGMVLEWMLMDEWTNDELMKKYPHSYNKFEKIDREIKNNALITLYKLEAFSSLLIHGNLNKKVAGEIIGYFFTKQVGFILGLISFFRDNTNDKFAQNTIKLYNEWNLVKKKNINE